VRRNAKENALQQMRDDPRTGKSDRNPAGESASTNRCANDRFSRASRGHAISRAQGAGVAFRVALTGNAVTSPQDNAMSALRFQISLR